ncbi:MAG: nicotinate (nicotinamide) nucleotide adenylyltransferase [Acidobacteria bacterium]|nr:MAG: nicotinate (nicotinamide) nucleotide adenylyltransferase [Acidobacteriota bacterium]
MALSSAPDARLRIALFGGTYDPIHNAHLKIAREAARQQHLSRVLFIPAAKPPHKSGVTRVPYENRLRMVELACQGEPLFEASRLEAGAQNSYSIETIERVRATLGKNQDLFFLIGSDAFAEIRTWHRWQEVIRSVEFIVVSRPGCTYEVPDGARVDRLDNVNLPVSSSEIREKLATGDEDVDVPQPVLQYIREHGLYRS